jgi:hypothetical protein
LNKLSMRVARATALGLCLGGLAAACTPLDDPSDVYDDDVTAEIGQELPNGQGQLLDETR